MLNTHRKHRVLWAG